MPLEQIQAIARGYLVRKQQRLSEELITAIDDNNINTVQNIIDRGFNVNRPYHGGVTPLHALCELGNLEIAHLFINNGADITIKDDFGNTPLHNASEEGHTDIAKLLINNGADVNGQNNQRYSPLHSASERGHTEIVKLLIQKNADVNIHDNIQYTALNYADNLKIAKLLVNNGANFLETIQDTPFIERFIHKKIQKFIDLKNTPDRVSDLSDAQQSLVVEVTTPKKAGSHHEAYALFADTKGQKRNFTEYMIAEKPHLLQFASRYHDKRILKTNGLSDTEALRHTFTLLQKTPKPDLFIDKISNIKNHATAFKQNAIKNAATKIQASWRNNHAVEKTKIILHRQNLI